MSSAAAAFNQHCQLHNDKVKTDRFTLPAGDFAFKITDHDGELYVGEGKSGKLAKTAAIKKWAERDAHIPLAAAAAEGSGSDRDDEKSRPPTVDLENVETADSDDTEEEEDCCERLDKLEDKIESLGEDVQDVDASVEDLTKEIARMKCEFAEDLRRLKNDIIDEHRRLKSDITDELRRQLHASAAVAVPIQKSKP